MPDHRWLLLRIPVLLAVALSLASCDDTALDPFQESPFPYSIFGYLDGGVDTQFVRITPVRDSIALGPGPIDATVTLEHLASGQKTTWHDSLFSYKTATARSERFGHNFWSPEALEPLATYRLIVSRSDGATSHVTVTLPDTFPDPEILGSTIKIRGIERLADVVVVYRVFDLILRQPSTYTVSYLQDAFAVGDEFWVLVDRGGDQDEITARLGGAPFLIISIEVTVAAAGPDWPDLTEIDNETLALPNVVSNVEEGIGYLGSIISKTFFWPGYEPVGGEGGF